MKRRNSDRNFSSLVFTLAVHLALASGIFYVGLEAVTPEAYVDLEVDFIDMDPPKGSQTKTPEVSKKESDEASRKTIAKKKAPKPKPKAKAKPKVVTAEKSETVIPTKLPDKPQEDIVNEDLKELDEYLDDPAKDAREDMAQEYNQEPTEDLDLAPVEEQGDAPVNSRQQVNETYGVENAVRSYRELRPIPGNPKPQYPRLARLRRQQGTILLEFYVDESAKVRKIRVVQGTGYDSLDDAAIAAVKRWRFRKDGKVGWFRKPIQFFIKGEAQEMPPSHYQ